MGDKIISAIQLFLIICAGLAATYAAITNVYKEQTKQKRIEEEEQTKRVELEAKEKSIGREALLLLRTEIAELQSAKKDSVIKLEKIERVIKQLEVMIEFIERRMVKENRQ